MRVAIAIVLGAIGLSFAIALVASWIGGDALELAYVVGMLIGLPAFLLMVPVLILAVIVDRAGRRAYPGQPIAFSWDVILDGEVHVVSLPATRNPAPDHAWIDGAKAPLSWTSTGVSTARAVVDGGPLSGTLAWKYDAREVAASVAFFLVSAVLAEATPDHPTACFALQVEGATVEAIPVAGGERRS